MIYDPAHMIMSNDVCEPVRLPRHSSPNYDAWMNFSKALAYMLRHTGSGERDGHRCITDDAGWATTAKIFATAAAWKKKPRLAPNLCINHVL
eukprot:9858450-Heterocapsa_arctica.AAC.1